MKQHKSVYSHWLRDTITVMAQLGLDTAAITRALPGLETSTGVSSSWVEVSVARQLWHNAFAVSGDSAIGFKVGSRLSLRAFNVLAPLLSHSPTVAVAIENAVRYQQLLSQSGNFRHRMEQDRVIATYHPAASHKPIHFTQIDSVIAAFVNAMRQLIYPQMEIIKVRLTGPPRENMQLYQDYFHCPVVIENTMANGAATQAAIEMPAAILKQEISNHDPGLYRICKSLAEDRLAQLQDVEQLHTSVAEAIANLGYNQADIHQVAAELALSSRTLQRRLQKSGSGFREIQEQVILRETVRLLQTTNISIQQLAQQLGYTESSSFSRAIKSISGHSPLGLKGSLTRDHS